MRIACSLAWALDRHEMSKRSRATYPRRWQQVLLGPADSFEARVTQGAAFGTFAALFGLLVGALRGVRAWGLDARIPASPTVWPVVAVYVGAMVSTGVAGGALWPMARHWAGRIVLALVLGFLFFVGPFVLLYGSPRRWDHEAWWVYRFCSAALAAIVWYAILRPERRAV